MKNTHLLDCTLRDGGYLNDWHFGKDNITNIFERVTAAGVDVIEVGFLDDRCVFNPERTIMPDTASATKIFGNLNARGAMLVGMIDYGTCDIKNIQKQSEGVLDGIRVIFKKDKMHGALAYCKQIKELGYKVFVQAVSITSYQDDELIELINLVNDCHPYALSMVDTYGLCDAPMLLHFVSVIDEYLHPEILLGYHAHNNFQLGYANAIAVLQSTAERSVMVDGTLYGMGKSAGNAPIELLAMYMNRSFGKAYSVSQLQEAISTSILDLYRKKPWGYTMFYYIAALNECHPDYVSYLMNKRTLSVTAVNTILQRIPTDQRLDKNMKLIENLYLEYQANECDDTEDLKALKEKFRGKKLLVLGPGPNIQMQAEKVQSYQRQGCLTIAVNYMPEHINVDCLFLTNSRRYLQMSSALAAPAMTFLPIIATSNVAPSKNTFDYTLNYSSLLDEKAEFQDNSMIMFLKLLIKLGIDRVALAGFDGYTADSVAYFDKNMEYSFVNEKANMLNQCAKDFFAENKERLAVEFVTTSFYEV